MRDIVVSFHSRFTHNIFSERGQTRVISGDICQLYVCVRAYAARTEDVYGNDLCTGHSTSLHRSSIPPLHALA